MAIEVDAMRYKFHAQLSRAKISEEDDLSEIWEKTSAPSNDIDISEPTVKTNAKFRYNPIHDLESIWWVATYFDFNKTVVQVGKTTVRRNKKQQQRASYTAQYKYAKGLFSNQMDRSDALSLPSGFQEHIQYLHESVQPVARILEHLRQLLVVCYEEAEKDTAAIGPTVAFGLYTSFAKAFRQAANELKQDVLLGSLEEPAGESGPIQGTGTQRMDDTSDVSDMKVPEQDVHDSDESSSNASSTVSA